MVGCVVAFWGWRLKPSSEVEAVVRRFLVARAELDVETMQSLLSRSDYVRLVGSTEEAWNQGYENAVDNWSDGNDELIQVADRTLLRVEAYENGDTGWAAVEQEITDAAGHTFIVRITIVVVIEDSVWKLAQIHFSVPSAGE